MKPARFITIPPSHYCEKARWALDHANVKYVEEGHPPLVHWAFTLPRTRTRTVPILLRDGARPLVDSSDILRFCDEQLAEEKKLFPRDCAAEVAALEDQFDEELGIATRRLTYCYVARNAKLFHAAFAHGMSNAERWIVLHGDGLLRAVLRKAFNVSDRARDRTRAKVEAQFAAVSEKLADGRPYILGDRFTAADLTFVALSNPVLMMGQRVDYIESLDAGFAELVRSMRATPAGAFAMRLHAEHRRPSGP
ncbi:MAG: glutathione S-transferase [Polyangiaceae bacterium]|nr:glutathione S-transferase [Polyangiaceae bacterium]